MAQYMLFFVCFRILFYFILFSIHPSLFSAERFNVKMSHFSKILMLLIWFGIFLYFRNLWMNYKKKSKHLERCEAVVSSSNTFLNTQTIATVNVVKSLSFANPFWFIFISIFRMYWTSGWNTSLYSARVYDFDYNSTQFSPTAHNFFL